MTTKKEIELWKDIEKYEGIYQISNLGRIKSVERVFYKRKARKNHELMPVYMPEKIRSKRITNRGYVKISLWNNNKVEHFLVHRLVAFYFVHNPKPNKYNQVLHLDNNPGNPRWDNLKWGTQKMNIQQSVSEGRWHTGSKNFQSKLKAEDIPIIRQLIADGVSLTKIGDRFGVTHCPIMYIKDNRTWKHVK